MADADDVEAGGGGPACAGQQSAVDEADVAPLLKSTNSSSHPAKADRTSKENSILLSLLKSTKALLG